MPDTIRIPDRVRAIVAEHLGQYHNGKVEPLAFEWDATLRSMNADSLDIVELTMAFEEEFGITIDDDVAFAWKTAGDMLATVEGKR